MKNILHVQYCNKQSTLYKLLSTTIFVITVVKMLWTHEAQPTFNAEPLSICFLQQYSTPMKVFILERDENHDSKKE